MGTHPLGPGWDNTDVGLCDTVGIVSGTSQGTQGEVEGVASERSWGSLSMMAGRKGGGLHRPEMTPTRTKTDTGILRSPRAVFL